MKAIFIVVPSLHSKGSENFIIEKYLKGRHSLNLQFLILLLVQLMHENSCKSKFLLMKKFLFTFGSISVPLSITSAKLSQSSL